MRIIYDKNNPRLEVVKASRAILMQWPAGDARPSIQIAPDYIDDGIKLPGTMEDLEFYSGRNYFLVVF